MREELEKAIERALMVSNPPPQNETETCHRIIYPLLLAAGYDYLDIKAQDLDASRSRPDYTLLADDPDYTWFLEAKTWSVTLEDQHAIQAINYANTQGKRWAVLSNGREWRLYDNHISGTAEVKLATVCMLGDDGFISFLDALSKPSILAGKLEGFVRNQRLYTTLASQLSKPDSDLIKAIVKSLRSTPGLASVTPSDVAGYFAPEHEATPPACEPILPEPEGVRAPSRIGQKVDLNLYEKFDFSHTEKPVGMIAGREFSGVYLPIS